ncbi:MAG TPA: glycosyltransferase [Candidatus Sulfotelmatobacter sp.]|nr:glycosyltransferase [Candidatus Sulfotelmatobacter sp.]
MSDLRISIAMATYNGEKYIGEQLESLGRQTLLPFELVVTDDGSSDRTLEILNAFSEGAPFSVRVFRNATRLGYEENFLKAASLCNGDVIAFCDQDDVWMERKLEVCASMFADPSIVGVLHTGQTMRDSGELGQFHPYFPRTTVLAPGDFDPFEESPGFSMLMRREMVDLADSRDRHHLLKSHDKWFCLLVANAGRLATLSDVLVWYRQHDRNVFGVPRRQESLPAIRSYAGAHDYTVEADAAQYCALVLERVAERFPERARLVERGALRFRYRSRLHRLRTQMYQPKSNIFSRVAKFLHIVLVGGYIPDRAWCRLGLKRGIKDMLWGVSGAYKLFLPSR